MLSRTYQSIKHFPFEALIWLSGLIALALLEPGHEHVSICPFRYFGFELCPGCGLGRSISYFFHGEMLSSLQTHPIGIIAVIILSLRIIKLSKLYLKTHGTSY